MIRERIANYCTVCHKPLMEIDYGDGVWTSPDEYEYRGNPCCGDCLDECIEKVEEERRERFARERHAQNSREAGKIMNNVNKRIYGRP